MVMNRNYVHRRAAQQCKGCGERCRPKRVALVNGVFVCVKCCCFRCLHALDRHTMRPEGDKIHKLRPNGHYLCPPCAAFVTKKAEENRWLAPHYAKLFIRNPMVSKLGHIRDVAQEAFLGVMRAAEDWRPERGEFSTHAFQHARAAIVAASYDGRLVRLPKPRAKYEPSREVAACRARAYEGARALGEDFDLPAPEPEERAEPEELVALRAALRCLHPRFRDVLVARFGLDGPPQLQRQIAGRLGITVSRVQQMIRKALTRLRRELDPGKRSRQ